MTLQEDDNLYDVSVTIPDLGGSTPEEAASVFWQILRRDWISLYFDVVNTATRERTTVFLSPREIFDD